VCVVVGVRGGEVGGMRVVCMACASTLSRCVRVRVGGGGWGRGRGGGGARG